MNTIHKQNIDRFTIKLTDETKDYQPYTVVLTANDGYSNENVLLKHAYDSRHAAVEAYHTMCLTTIEIVNNR